MRELGHLAGGYLVTRGLVQGWDLSVKETHPISWVERVLIGVALVVLASDLRRGYREDS